MAQVRKCYAENCEGNYMGAYCEWEEIIIDENGCCGSYFSTKEDEQTEEAERELERRRNNV